MENVNSLCTRMAARVARLSGDKNLTPSAVPQVPLLYTTRYHPRQPVLYNPGIVILFHHRRTGKADVTGFGERLAHARMKRARGLGGGPKTVSVSASRQRRPDASWETYK